jgi:hypothetical protein
VLLAAGPALGGPVAPERSDSPPQRRSDVAAAPEAERLSPLTVEEPSGLPVELFFGAIGLALIALPGMAVSVARALR